MRTIQIFAATLLATTTCKDDDVDRETAWSRAYIEAACAKAYDNECDCSVEQPFSSAKVCEQYQQSPVRRAQNESIAAGLVFDEACAYAIVDEIDALGCEVLDESFMLAESCQVYFGDKALGDPCTPHYWGFIANHGFRMSDCEQGLVCAPAGLRCTTPEMPYVALAADASCADTMGNALGRCPDPQQCDPGSSLCVMPAALGDPCPDDFPCADSWCDAGTCVARKADGATCEMSIECASLYCSEGRCVDLGPLAAACVAHIL